MMNINPKVVKALVLLLGILGILIYFSFVWLLSIEITKVYSLMKYLKHPDTSWVAAKYSFSLVLISTAFSLAILSSILDSKFCPDKFKLMARILSFVALGLAIQSMPLLFFGAPDDIFVIRHSKLFTQLSLENAALGAKLTMIFNCFKDGIMEFMGHLLNVRYIALIVVTIFGIFFMDRVRHMDVSPEKGLKFPYPDVVNLILNIPFWVEVSVL
ncbi:hypothetical protein HRbin17_00585 [bacterium HR17]|uniref:Uncharacterized protein n=1 Tax=Candidatus Fervidibacter japonicus TaxID=2035412 RepID=A0A2H5XA79_9BACT|nr:hypothetical protein HRbin17_00585 [bacterium HR17]